MILEFNGQPVRRNIRPLGFWEKIIGLADNRPGDAVYFRTRWGIHTFGLSEPIDVLVLGERGEFGVLFRKLPPGQARFWNPKFRQVFEFPAGTLSEIENPADGIFVWYDEKDE